MPYPGWSAKRVRMYKHILDTGASKSEAAATVNKTRRKKGELKQKKKKRA